MLIMSSILGLSMIGCSSSKIDKEENIATVNGNGITVGNYQIVLELNKQSIQAYYGDTIWDQEVEDGVTYREKFKEMILDQMVYTESIYQKAKDEKLLATEDEVNKAIEDFKTSIKENEDYQKELDELGVDDNFLKYQFERDLASENYKANFEKNIDITEDEMKTYYDENKEEFHTDEVEASHILIKTMDDQGNALSDKKKAEAKKKAEEVLEKLKSGEEFSALAKEYSQDAGTAENGGELGFFAKGKMVKEFEDAAWKLNVGEISDIVETSYGYHIIKVTDKVDEQQPFEDVKDTIKTNLISEKYNEQVEKLKSDSKVEINKDILGKIEI
ncbi:MULTISPECIES: peptidylprolyl isomerase [unclassified Romboutsia]|uniref:peptidylprolyl isomerase n=1 Tax=unclassified Romboutsia TaxID=2626894 RepID=UPI0024326310|nr:MULTISPECIES: peptidylprolyl isomerase [unclassified Romboutsia]